MPWPANGLFLSEDKFGNICGTWMVLDREKAKIANPIWENAWFLTSKYDFTDYMRLPLGLHHWLFTKQTLDFPLGRHALPVGPNQDRHRGQQLLTPNKTHLRICDLRSIGSSFCQGPRPYQLWWLSPWGLVGMHKFNGKTSQYVRCKMPWYLPRLGIKVRPVDQIW